MFFGGSLLAVFDHSSVTEQGCELDLHPKMCWICVMYSLKTCFYFLLMSCEHWTCAVFFANETTWRGYKQQKGNPWDICLASMSFSFIFDPFSFFLAVSHHFHQLPPSLPFPFPSHCCWQSRLMAGASLPQMQTDTLSRLPSFHQ